jgi:hypothetical protein
MLHAWDGGGGARSRGPTGALAGSRRWFGSNIKWPATAINGIVPLKILWVTTSHNFLLTFDSLGQRIRLDSPPEEQFPTIGIAAPPEADRKLTLVL